MNNRENGNVLFLILIAVALFAALSYAVTKSTSGGGNASSEKTKLKVTEFLNYASSIKVAVDRLRVINGCSGDQINFWDNGHLFGSATLYSWNADNPSAPADNSCDIFHADGGGMPLIKFDQSWFTHAQGNFGFMSAPIQGVGSTDADLSTHGDYDTFFWGLYIDRDICQGVNKTAGITSTLPSLSIGVGRDYLYSTGATDASAILGAEHAGQNVGCYCYAADECNLYYVLIAR